MKLIYNSNGFAINSGFPHLGSLDFTIEQKYYFFTTEGGLMSFDVGMYFSLVSTGWNYL